MHKSLRVNMKASKVKQHTLGETQYRRVKLSIDDKETKRIKWVIEFNTLWTTNPLALEYIICLLQLLESQQSHKVLLELDKKNKIKYNISPVRVVAYGTSGITMNILSRHFPSSPASTHGTIKDFLTDQIHEVIHIQQFCGLLLKSIKASSQ